MRRPKEPAIALDVARELRALEGRYRRLFEHNLAGVYRTTLGGRILDCNDEFARIFGFASRDEALRSRAQDLYANPADRDALIDELRRAGSFTGRELRFVRRDGSTVWLLKSELLVANEDGEETLEGIIWDVTERHDMELRLVQNERLAALGTLAAGVGHEINNPLAYILANLDYALEELSRPDGRGPTIDLVRALAEAREGAKRVREIVANLRTFSRTDDTGGEATDVPRALDAALKLTANELRHRARVVTDYGPVPRVSAQPSRLGQVFVNLLVNAAHAMREGDAARNELRIATRTDERGRAVVEIRDTGRGMSPEVLRRAFEPFFTTKPVGEGTGLGLSICHGIVTSLGGEIAVASEEGRGTTVTVRLPPSARASARPRPASVVPPSNRPRAAKLRVLVVDDEEAIGRSLARRLRGCEVVATTDGRAALERLVGGEAFDLVLCDVMMPDFGGVDFYEALLRERPSECARVVFMTGGALTARATDLLARTNARCIEKPFDSKVLQEIVARLRPDE